MPQPDSFCWSKFGTEAGEPVEQILARKEQERLRNAGVFLWGIGTSIRPSLRALLSVTNSPNILFTPMLSKPARIDVAPDAVAVWTAAIGMDGSTYEIPKHSTVSSRFAPGRQRRHFALVCSSDTEISNDSVKGQHLYRSELRNFLNGTELGASQVTAVVRRVATARRMERPHRVAFSATLAYPYLVELLHPVAVKQELAPLT